ncbi:Ribonuclease T2 protein rnst-2 [Caenorhabditis elegans]|uniref:Ribonuclease T2 protein rnst-2 n=1 Tax=Caenorhabditis elegans TaxID=6239 RepID=RNST2_CAEEL|nr:Ribonuclease T2 protein rnst-2 [Caenorhabditis elegans]O61887.2 RecName: Full=Ribonuclease T2 protein rnst-2; AltName: Full=RNase T2 rnst-2; Flags: Precursor [Caenorhabditis elegans]CCD62615.1 Ribonuclease T2 protein rnst-2 [Caenorhabditis elegans]|eukprot:NP_503370.1 RiboNucleaSe T homolog [Caenorhabditis elegans]
MKLLLLLCISCIPLAYSHDGEPFDYLMFTTIYPTAVCRADDDSVPESCEIPSGTPQWSIHGLWPNFENGSYPQNCRGTPRHFDENLIKSIEDRLVVVWPNLYPKKTIQSFWKHEYDKHGTCAQSEKLFESELAYFTEVMKVFDSIDVAGGLKSVGPSEKPITSSDLKNALSGVTSGKTFQFHCLRDKKTKQFLLGDIRLCLNKDLTIRDCPTDGKHPNRVSRFERSIGRNRRGPPLPSFQPCPAEFIYLPEMSSISKSSDSTSPSIFGRIWSAIKNIGN